MVAPVVGGFSALPAVTKPASNAAAKSIFVRALMTGLYSGARDCKAKNQPTKPQGQPHSESQSCYTGQDPATSAKTWQQNRLGVGRHRHTNRSLWLRKR